MRRLIFRSFQSPGDVVMLTAAVRDLHRAHPGQFLTDVRTSADDLWTHNPYLTSLSEGDPHVEVIDAQYPLIHDSNSKPCHFLQGYPEFLGQRIGVSIPVSEFRGDIHLSEAERTGLPDKFRDLSDGFWIIVAGGKYDFTAKWWNPGYYQAVVNHFRGRISFIQCGESRHWHLPLDGVTNLVGCTNLREFVQLMHHAAGVVCPVTLAMHLAAAVDTPAHRPAKRPCVVIAGGREPPHWEAYPTHQFISTVGTLDCCATGGCWRSRCQRVGDGDRKDRQELCERPAAIRPNLTIPACMQMISPEDVIRRVNYYLNPSVGTQASTQIGQQSAKASSVQSGNRTKRRAPVSQPALLISIADNWRALATLPVLLAHSRHYYPTRAVCLAAEEVAFSWFPLLNTSVEPVFVAPGENGPCEQFDLGAINAGDVQTEFETTSRVYLRDTLHLSPLDELCEFRREQSDERKTEAKRVLRHDFGLQVNGPLWLFHQAEPLDESIEVGRFASSQVAMVRLTECDTDDTLALQVWNAESRLWNSAIPVPAEATPAIIAAADCLIGFDSPLLQWSAALGTPGIGVWRCLHPLQMVDPCRWIAHLVPEAAEPGVTGAEAAKQFERRYKIRRYSHSCEIELLLSELLQAQWPADIDKPSESAPAIQQSVSTLTEQNLRRHRRDTVGALLPTAQYIGHSPPTATMDVRRPVSTDNVDHAVRFYHGLGDCAYFARLLELYRRRGIRIGVECTPDKEILFRAAGAAIVRSAPETHPWGYPPLDVQSRHDGQHAANKAAWNLSEPPFPDIGDKATLWDEYCHTELRIGDSIGFATRNVVAEFLDELPRPIVLLHTKGNTAQERKSLPDRLTTVLYRELLDRFDGTLVLLDWDDRVPTMNSFRVRHLKSMPQGCSTVRLLALMEAADLMVGVDSGPLHLSTLTDVPRVGIWMPGHYPARYTLPSSNQLNLVLAGETSNWNRYYRVPWNIVEQPGTIFEPGWLADQITAMLMPTCYLDDSLHAADIQLGQWVREWCRGDRSDLQAAWTDRNRSFDVLLRECRSRFTSPCFVETGTIRSEEDWAGAGFSTYIFGRYAQHCGGTLDSVDLNPAHCRFARTWTAVFGNAVRVHCRDSVLFLSEWQRPIDVLYVDSLDTYEPGHAEHALREVQAALPHLHERSLILIDDTPFGGTAFSGKGAMAVPWLKERGWTVRYAGYQILLQREGP